MGRARRRRVMAPGNGCVCTQQPACRRDAQLRDCHRAARPWEPRRGSPGPGTAAGMPGPWEPCMILPGLCQPPHGHGREAVWGKHGSELALAASHSAKSPSLKDAVNPQPAPMSRSKAPAPLAVPRLSGFSREQAQLTSTFPPSSPFISGRHYRASVPTSRWDCIPVTGLSTSCCD